MEISILLSYTTLPTLNKVVNTLCDTKTVSLHLVEKGWTAEALLLWVARKMDPPFRALIDSGALITGFSNEQVVRFCLTHGLSWAHAAVFLDSQDRQMAVYKSGGEPVPLSQCSVSPRDRFTFYDQCHTTGMDIKQALDSCAVATLAKSMVMRDHTQACWRMRQLGEGQTIVVVIVPEVAKMIAETKLGDDENEVRKRTERWRGRNPTDDQPHMMLADVLLWLVHSSLSQETMMRTQLLVQEVRRPALST